MINYNSIYACMKTDVKYTAQDFGVTNQSMNAMVRRDLIKFVGIENGKKYYKKIYGKTSQIRDYFTNNLKKINYFGLYKENEKIGTLCYFDDKNGSIVDYNGKIYPINEAIKFRVGDQYICLK